MKIRCPNSLLFVRYSSTDTDEFFLSSDLGYINSAFYYSHSEFLPFTDFDQANFHLKIEILAISSKILLSNLIEPLSCEKKFMK